MTDKSPGTEALPALFATIHFKSDERPDGYTEEDLADLNAIANGEKDR